MQINETLLSVENNEAQSYILILKHLHYYMTK